jgi:hypothetical protein
MHYTNMNINFHIYVKFDNELVQRYFKSCNNKTLDESQKVRDMIWGEHSNRDEIYE